MDLIEAIYSRRSVRKYAATPVERATLLALLQAATQAPSAMNAQPWAFGIIEGVDVLRAYSDRIKAAMLEMADQLPWIERYRAMFADPAYNTFYGAPALILICAKPTGPHAAGDCAMAAENLMLAAHAQGLGACWIGFAQLLMERPEVKEELGIPADYSPVAPIIVGYPDGQMPTPEKHAPEIIFWQ